ncbi:MAG: hypothetical protein WC482_00770 [Candidatus Omnitrophota bacterium]|jgi:hypothetical protein
MLNFLGCAGGFKYEKYSGKSPGLDFTIDYISGWEHYEQIGSFNSFVQVGFYEPVVKDKSLRAMIVLTVEDSSKVNFLPKTIDGMLNDLVRRRMLFNSTRILSKTRKNICGEKAIDIEFSYRALADFESIKAKLVPMTERVVIFKRGEKFYTLRYADLADSFDKYSKAFTHIIKSMKFK